jgi:hypothetical protein
MKIRFNTPQTFVEQMKMRLTFRQRPNVKKRPLERRFTLGPEDAPDFTCPQ